MKINTYNLIVDKYTRHTSLQVKESYFYGQNEFTSSEAIVILMKELFQLQKQADEYVYMLAFNVKMRLLGIFEVSHGTGNASLLDARGVFMRALQIGANNVILVHNHPSGNALPSKDDLAISRRIKEAGNIIGIPLIDHVIIGGCEYVSLHEKELL